MRDVNSSTKTRRAMDSASVITVNYKGARLLPACLKGLACVDWSRRGDARLDRSDVTNLNDVAGMSSPHVVFTRRSDRSMPR